jgi:hypothetical protein
MQVLQMVHNAIARLLHLFLGCCLDYPWFSMHVNVYLTPSTDEPPVLKDQPGALRVNHASLVDHEGMDSTVGVGSMVVVGV